MVVLSVIVMCERSGVVRRAFRKLGHKAYSCDTEPADDGSPYHYQMGARALLQGDTWWDLMIAHPPCTYLANSGVSWLVRRKYKTTSSGADKVDIARWNKMVEASNFFRKLWKAPIPHICIENPIPHKYGKLPKYTQIIQPWMFGHPESKATCLWLKNLPKLTATNNVKSIMDGLPKRESQRLHYLSPGPERARLRSVTFEGIAEAMAKQWSEYLQ